MERLIKASRITRHRTKILLRTISRHGVCKCNMTINGFVLLRYPEAGIPGPWRWVWVELALLYLSHACKWHRYIALNEVLKMGISIAL